MASDRVLIEVIQKERLVESVMARIQLSMMCDLQIENLEIAQLTMMRNLPREAKNIKQIFYIFLNPSFKNNKRLIKPAASRSILFSSFLTFCGGL